MFIATLALSAVLVLQGPSLDSGSPKEREAAIDRLSVAGNTAGIPELAGALKKEPRSDLRARIVVGLARIKDKAVIPVLVDTLRTDLDKDVRLQAIDSIQRLYIDVPDAGTIQTIFNKVRSAFVGADRPVVVEGVQVDAQAKEGLATAMQKDFNVDVRAAAATALGSLRAKDQVASLVTTLEDPQNREHPDVRFEIIQSLGLIRDPAAGPALRKVLTDQNKDLVEEAETSIGLTGFKEARPDLEDLYKNNRDRVIRRRALDAMAMLRDPGSIPFFESLLGDSDDHNREKAAEGLARLHYDPSKLQFRITNEKKSNVRIALAFAMAAGGQNNYINDIANALDSSDSGQAEAYLFELGKYEGKLTLMLPYAQSTSPRVRAKMARTLGNIADPASRDTVEMLTKDGNDEVVREAIAALRKLNAR
jgi:HEAT repeat protein